MVLITILKRRLLMRRVAVHNRAEEASHGSPRFARPVTVLKITIRKNQDQHQAAHWSGFLFDQQIQMIMGC
jgi:hypothetical protein